jgi:hypothetical protein
MKPTVLALDLEGTLISNAISQIPRPGLHRFALDVQSQFNQLVMFTTVPRIAFAPSLNYLAAKEVLLSGLRVSTTFNGRGRPRTCGSSSRALGKRCYSMTMDRMSIRDRSTCGFRFRFLHPHILQAMMGS